MLICSSHVIFVCARLWEAIFWYGSTSWPYLGKVSVAKSLGQSQGQAVETAS